LTIHLAGHVGLGVAGSAARRLTFCVAISARRRGIALCVAFTSARRFAR
jgi:hypothetical protein